MRMANAFYDTATTESESHSSTLPGQQQQQRRKDDLQRLNLCIWSFVRSMKRHLSPESEDEINFQAELYHKLPTKEQASQIIQAQHRPNRALQDLSMAIENLPIHFLRKTLLHESVKKFEDNLGGCERLLSSPVPIFYNRHTTRLLTCWLLALPLALYDSFASTYAWLLVPATAMLSLFLFGIEELATQLEEPFSILPMQSFCDKIFNWCTEICSFR